MNKLQITFHFHGISYFYQTPRPARVNNDENDCDEMIVQIEYNDPTGTKDSLNEFSEQNIDAMVGEKFENLHPGNAERICSASDENL